MNAEQMIWENWCDNPNGVGVLSLRILRDYVKAGRGCKGCANTPETLTPADRRDVSQRITARIAQLNRG